MNRTPAVQQELWSRIKDHLNIWYHKLDTKPITIALSQYVAHTKLNDVPVWSFILGSSSSGKSIPIKAVSYLPNTHKLDDTNKNSFLSGAKNSEGILEAFKELPNGTKNGVILIPDFSTILNLYPEERSQIQAQLRRIYDGELKKDTGIGTTSWKGKVTVIAACTPAIERYWGLGHDLGERFVYYRIPITDSEESMDSMSDRTIKQINHDAEIEKNFKQLILQFVGLEDKFPNISTNSIDWKEEGLISLVTLVAKVRRSVSRDTYSKNRDIIDIDPPESPARLMKALAQVTIGHTMLMREPIINSYNIAVAKELAFGSIPFKRGLILKALIAHGTLNASVLTQITHIPYTTIHRVIEDMEAMSIVTVVRIGQVSSIQLHPEIVSILHKAKILK
jgi:hypothetical protein